MAPSLDIVIVGAGISGLATALAISQLGQNHRITVLEAGPSLSEFGAGIQLGANATRLLHHWGLQEPFRAVVNEPNVMAVQRYSDDSTIGEIAQNPQSAWQYGFPHWQCFRPDLQRLLADACAHETQLGRPLEIRFGAKAVSVVPSAGTLTLADGSVVAADLIVGADGIRSRLRPFIPGLQDFHARPSEHYCYRAVVHREKMLTHPQTTELMTAASLSMVWCGPELTVLGYPVAGGSLYNIVVSVSNSADPDDVGLWSQPGDVHEVAQLLKPFCERVQRLWSMVEECNKWTIGELAALPTFASDNGKFVLIGDAAHAILPHSGQGGAMALEDAAALATAISRLPAKSDLKNFMHAWSSARQDRLVNLRRLAIGNANLVSLPDGPEQEKRDHLWAEMTRKWKKELEEIGEEGIRKAAQVEPDESAADVRTPEARMYINGYDAYMATAEYLKKAGLAH